MALFIGFLLEILRIIALLILIPSLVVTLITSVLTSIGVEVTGQVKGVISFIAVIAFVYWYRRRGQNSGWFKVN